jgi:hypothetical protein
MIFLYLSTDKKENSRFLVKFVWSPCSKLSIRETCMWCLPPLVYDALLHFSRNILLAALTDSCLFWISLFSCCKHIACRCKVYWYPINTFLYASEGRTPPWLTACFIVSHSATDSWTFTLAARVSSMSLIRLKRIYNFWCSMLVYTPFALCFVYTSWCF